MAHLIETGWTNRRLVMGYEEITRKLAFGGNWQRIRIGIRGCIVASAAGTWSAGMSLGAFSSAGVGGGFIADRSEAYAGMVTNGTSPSMNIASSGSNLYAQWAGSLAYRRSNITVTANNTGLTAMFFSATQSIRSALIVDIVKSTTGVWTYAMSAPSSAANALIDKSYAQFLNDVSRTDAVPTGMIGLSVQPANPGAPFINKTLDMVSFAWNMSAIRVQVQNFAVFRIN